MSFKLSLATTFFSPFALERTSCSLLLRAPPCAIFFVARDYALHKEIVVMSPDPIVTLGEAIGALQQLGKNLRDQLLIFGAVAIVGVVGLSLAGTFYEDNSAVPITAFVVFLVMNIFIIFKYGQFRQAVQQQRSAAEAAKEWEDQFSAKARMALDSLTLSAKGIISTVDAGTLAEGWRNHLQDRGIDGFWQGEPRIFAKSLSAEYREPGPASDGG